MKVDKYKRVLVVSHNCFSKTGSNGRTLMNYLVGWDKEKIAQLYIHSEQPDFSVCERFFCVTDSAVMRSILKRRPAGRIVKDIPAEIIEELKGNSAAEPKKVRKNSLMALIREAAWMSPLWNAKRLNSWIDEFNPQVILFQAGDGAFLFRLVRRLAEKRNIPVIIYNTEGYYFKKKSYFPEKSLTKLFYPVLHRLFCREYKKLIKVTKHSIYNCDLLCEDYNRAFNKNDFVIMNTSEFTDEEVFEEKENRFIYAGNLGLLRHKGLIEFAEALKKVDSRAVLEVYGKAPTDKVINDLEECEAIEYRGLIPYEELKEKLKRCRFLVHTESFNEFFKEDLKYAFSTKVADSLASGGCLLVYAPENMAVSQYIKETRAGVLERTLSELLNNEERVKEISCSGRALALENHNILKNREKFQQLIIE